MNLLKRATAEYRSELLPEKLGWVVFKSARSFRLVHRVWHHPLDGPVILVEDEVWEIDIDGPVYVSETAARDGYWAAQKEQQP